MIGPGDGTIRNLAIIGQQAGSVGEDARANKYDGQATCDLVKELAQAGRWPVTWAARCGVTFQTFKNWAQAYPEFLEALVIGRYLLASHWADKVGDNVLHPNFKMSATLKMLERKLPDEWGPNAPDVWAELGLTGREEVLQAPQELARSMSTKDLEARMQELARRREVMQEEAG